MKPPYQITSQILNLISSISQKIGEVNATYLIKNNPTLRKQNQIKTIHSSLNIEGNTLSEDQITAILENKKVLGPQKDITEVLNALKIYQDLNQLKFNSERDYLKAHQTLMSGLIENPGKYRTTGVGIMKCSKVEHIAPPSENVPYLMKDLFSYLKDNSELSLIKSCVFHYEMEFIHPFLDGNGRMGRLWQTLILTNEFPIFEFLPFETLIAKNQIKYYQALSRSDKEGHSTKFIEYMLGIIDESLSELLGNSIQKLTDNDRILIFLENTKDEFSRKDYMKKFSEISSATASRDLKNAVEKGLIEKSGDKKTSLYKKT
ncbi:Adenosine monophosphate-protein transferase SoFic [Chryseobacterium aquaeductus]|uniref:Adenosine monophosphate-protein transferase SoFic n=1 Tax=Chryseobacterium aquaeductus TaxID=2675056 RepID=A0A9N8MLL2_9FLAO|nr:Fic family protein [Chryseobacterium aquaeductus]CAA7329933.1 Adenosine monophosphate-protein transferase SoFic [Chryseobacterium potabilaquae]CAD7800102.1 Adenosine monophosphate-protein transferase SoFic [Chryseobacterium aquaeductus]